MKKQNTVIEFTGREIFSDALTELLRSGARALIKQAVEAELGEFMEHSGIACRMMAGQLSSGMVTCQNARFRPGLALSRCKCRRCGFNQGSRSSTICCGLSVFLRPN